MPLISRRGFSGLKIPRVAEAAVKKVRNLHERTDHRVRPLRRRADQSGMGSRKSHERRDCRSKDHEAADPDRCQ